MSDNQTTDFAGEVGKLRVLMEQQNSKLDAVLEGVGDIQRRVADSPTRAEFDALKQDVKTITAVTTATNSDLAKHKQSPADKAHGLRQVGQSRWAAA